MKKSIFDTSRLNEFGLVKTSSTLRSDPSVNSSYEIENFLKVVTDVSEGDPFKVLLDPTYTGFKIFFHFDAQNGLLSDESNINSALAYLKRIGQIERYNLLKRFITVLSMINSITPWMFQEITGLEELWSRKRTDVLLKDHEITINTLETLDGKMQSIVNMYREISWDDDRKVYVLPVNLRRFSMSIYVYDFRVFGSGSTTAYSLLQTIKNTDIRRLNHTLFDLGYCEFTEDSGKSYFNSVTNNNSEQATSNLTIKYESSTISSLFRSITGNMNLTSSTFELVSAGTTNTANIQNLSNQEKIWIDRLAAEPTVQTEISIDADKTMLQSAKDSVKNAIKNSPSYLAEQTAEIATSIARSKLNGLFMGNIYGFSILENIRKVEKIKDLRQAYEQVRQIDSSNSRMQSLNTTQYSDNLGNINS